MLAQALAYSLFLAIPATALVVLGIFSLVADPSVIEDVVNRAGRVEAQPLSAFYAVVRVTLLPNLDS